jgi:1-acyl-sn-glycerol-3-phosphate acyltransferase
MKYIRGTIRVLLFGLGAMGMLMRIAIVNAFRDPDLKRSLRYRQEFIRWLIPAVGAQVEFFGEPPKGAGLLMCNHRSYFDPVPGLFHVWAVPVGKAEVRKWPVIGLGGHLSGTVYVDRSTKEGRQAARDKINQRLSGGYSILIYPEGTICKGPELGELKMGMFRDAAKHGYTIHPMAIEYQHADDVWTHDLSFPQHFYKRFGAGSVHIRVSYGTPMQGDNAEDLAKAFKTWIEAEIIKLRTDWYIAGDESSS